MKGLFTKNKTQLRNYFKLMYENSQYFPGLLKKTISIISLVIGTSAHSYQSPLFGPEFTFTNNEITLDYISYKNKNSFFYNKFKTPASLAALKDWKNELKLLCQNFRNCRVEKTSDKHGVAYKVTFNDGFWFQVSFDESVIEVQTKPETLQNFKLLKDRINTYIFDLAEKLNLRPDWITGGGHLNMGVLSAFDNDPFLFRNWLVDLANNPELFWGILGKDLKNAPTLTDLGKERIEAFYKIIQEFDKNPTDIIRLASRIKNEVYTFNPAGLNEIHNQNVNFNSITPTTYEDLQRTEVRGVRPQENFDVFLLQIELFYKRVKYLKTLTEPLPLNVPLTSNVSFEQLVKKFYFYITEMSESFKKYSPLIKDRLYGYNYSLIEELEKLPYPTVQNIRISNACYALFLQ